MVVHFWYVWSEYGGTLATYSPSRHNIIALHELLLKDHCRGFANWFIYFPRQDLIIEGGWNHGQLQRDLSLVTSKELPPRIFWMIRRVSCSSAQNLPNQSLFNCFPKAERFAWPVVAWAEQDMDYNKCWINKAVIIVRALCPPVIHIQVWR